MKVTPLEIRQKAFEKTFRGYDKDEVEAYLLSLSQEWEKLLDKNKDFTLRLEAANRELAKLHEIENSLFKTLKTAEDTSNNIIEQANKNAELQEKESIINSEKLLNESHEEAKFILDAAHEKSDEIISRAENEAKVIMDDMLANIKELEYHFHEINTARDNVIEELQHLNKDIIGKVEKAERIKSEKKKKLDKILSSANKQKRAVYAVDSVKSPAQKSDPELLDEKVDDSPITDESEKSSEFSENISKSSTIETNSSDIVAPVSNEGEEVEESQKESKEKSFFDSL